MTNPTRRPASRARRVYSLLRLIITLVGVAAGIGPAATGAEPALKHYEIPSGPAASSLRLFTEQSGEQVVFFVNKVRDVVTAPVQGNFDTLSALNRLLAGTPLYAVQDEKTRALIINRIEPPPPVMATVAPPPRPTKPPATPSSGSTAEAIHNLPAFTITSERDVTYVGREALSTTRTGVDVAELPQSVVVLNKTFIDDLNPTILAKALIYVGGAQTGTISWSVDRYMIRGFVGEGDYVDGFRTQTDKNTSFNLIDHIEVIKGPAAIFIANQSQTVGGVINKISKSPTDYPVASVTLQAGLWDGNRADLDVGGPLIPSGKLMGRLLVSSQDSKGYYDSTYEKRLSILPMLGFRLGPATEGWVKFESFSSHYSAYNGLPLDGRTNRILDVPWRRNLNENTPKNWRTDWFTRLWALFTTRPTDFLAVRISALDSKDTQRRVESVLNPSGATVPTVGADGVARFLPYPQYVVPPTYTPGTPIPRTVTAIDSDYQPRSELQNDYVFSFNTGPATHTFLLGGDLIDYPEVTRTYSSGPMSTAQTSGIDPFDPSASGVTAVNFDQPPADVTQRTQKFSKLFALETVGLLDDRLLFSYGASRNRYALSSRSTPFNQTGGPTPAPTVVPRAVLFKNLVQYGIVAKPLPNVSVFYGYNHNFSSNGVQFGSFLPPQEGEQKEIGVKSEWLGGRVVVGVNHFDVVQINNSVNAYPQTTPPSNVLVPGTISHGFDGDFSASLAHNLDLVGSFALFRAHVPLAAPYNVALQPYDNRVHRDIPVNNVSQRNLAAWVRYKSSVGRLSGLAVGLGASYLDRRAITDNTNSIFYGYLPSRTLLDAMISYETKHLHWQLNIDNVLDRHYIYAVRSNQVLVPGSPTNLRLTVTWKL